MAIESRGLFECLGGVLIIFTTLMGGVTAYDYMCIYKILVALLMDCWVTLWL